MISDAFYLRCCCFKYKEPLSKVVEAGEQTVSEDQRDLSGKSGKTVRQKVGHGPRHHRLCKGVRDKITNRNIDGKADTIPYCGVFTLETESAVEKKAGDTGDEKGQGAGGPVSEPQVGVQDELNGHAQYSVANSDEKEVT